MNAKYFEVVVNGMASREIKPGTAVKLNEDESV
jgi:hypothetical protein